MIVSITYSKFGRCLRCAMFSIAPVDRSSTTSTWWPRSSSASARCDPTKPAPPVNNALIYRCPRLANQPKDLVRGARGGLAVGTHPVRVGKGRGPPQQRRASLPIIQERAQRLAGTLSRGARHHLRLDEGTQVVGQPDDERGDAQHQPVDRDRRVLGH